MSKKAQKDEKLIEKERAREGQTRKHFHVLVCCVDSNKSVYLLIKHMHPYVFVLYIYTCTGMIHLHL